MPYRDITICRQTLFLVFAGHLSQGFPFHFGQQDLFNHLNKIDGNTRCHRLSAMGRTQGQDIYRLHKKLESKKKLKCPPLSPLSLSSSSSPRPLLPLSFSGSPSLPAPILQTAFCASQPLLIQQPSHVCSCDLPMTQLQIPKETLTGPGWTCPPGLCGSNMSVRAEGRQAGRK